jgi:hypothetical protein
VQVPEILEFVVLCQPEMLCVGSRNFGPIIVSSRTDNPDNLELAFWLIHKFGGRIPDILE